MGTRNDLQSLGFYQDLIRIVLGLKASKGFLGCPRKSSEVLGNPRNSRVDSHAGLSEASGGGATAEGMPLPWSRAERETESRRGLGNARVETRRVEEVAGTDAHRPALFPALSGGPLHYSKSNVRVRIKLRSSLPGFS